MDNHILNDRIRSAKQARFGYFSKIASIACHSKFRMGPSDDEMLLTFGADLTTTIKVLMDHAESYHNHDIAMALDKQQLPVTDQTVDDYLKNVANERHIYETLITLVESWIKKNRKDFHDPQLEAEICAADNDEWINQDDVTEFYNDGQITSQKGGELYGHRSVFTMAPALLHNFNLTLPRKNGERTFAIVKSTEVAGSFRDRMIALSNK
jgi:hypothetical protein